MKFKLDPGVKESWVQALRSGRYQQGRGALCRGGQHCCLGVFAKEQGVLGAAGICEIGGESTVLDSSILPMEVQRKLISMNDGYGQPKKSFNKIADFIEEEL